MENFGALDEGAYPSDGEEVVSLIFSLSYLVVVWRMDPSTSYVRALVAVVE